nr:nuclear transport factor 2 family protein [Dysgonomonas sp. 511]
MKKKDGDYRKDILSANDESIKAKIISLEKQALALWNDGNPDGFLELTSEDVVYIDPAFERKLEGKKALEDYYNTVRGKIKIDQYEIINPTVQLSANVAVLTYNYVVQRDGLIFRMSCTEVYKLDIANQWKIIHTHWSFNK